MNCAWSELLAVLPPWIRSGMHSDVSVQEIRLRIGQPPVLLCADARRAMEGRVSGQDLRFVVNMACRYSPWTAETSARGYLTIAGGHRIGLCGQALLRNGKMDGIRQMTSLNIRICRDFPGVSRNLWLRPGSVLLIGPPGSGKTTLLRDLIRRRSCRETVAVVDERGELFPTAAAFDAGENTDILTGCSKEQGIDMLLRTMGPQCIAVDEITAQQDCDALIRAGKCGVALLATAHAASVEELKDRPVYARLMKSGLFEQVVVLQMDKSWRTERMCV